MTLLHTPAPWFYDNDGFVYGGPELLIVSDPHSSIELLDQQELGEMEANGVLIAAAPDMLEALLPIVNSGEPGEDAVIVNMNR